MPPESVPPYAELPPPPAVSVEVARELEGSSATGGFLDLRRLVLVLRFRDGRTSAPFAYDVATRASLDAVVLVAHYRERGVRHVFLRSAVRPPLALRTVAPAMDPSLWELPAGLIDAGETPRDTAARELEEELGFSVEPADFRELGPTMAPSAGVIGELHMFFHVEVDPARRNLPTEDGSPLEMEAAICALPLERALEECRRGAIRDAKTELALRRLAELT